MTALPTLGTHEPPSLSSGSTPPPRPCTLTMTGRRGRKRRCHTAGARRPGWRNPPGYPSVSSKTCFPMSSTNTKGAPPGMKPGLPSTGGRGAEPLTRTYHTLQSSQRTLLPLSCPRSPARGPELPQQRAPPHGALAAGSPTARGQQGGQQGDKGNCNRTSREENLCFMGGGAVLPGARMSLSLSTRGTLFHCPFSILPEVHLFYS